MGELPRLTIFEPNKLNTKSLNFPRTIRIYSVVAGISGTSALILPYPICRRFPVGNGSW